jgi:hypothetical protein
METKEVKLYVMAIKQDYDIEFEILVSTYAPKIHEMSGNGIVIPLSEVTIEVPLPDIDRKKLNAEHVKALEIQMKEEKNASYIRIKSIEEKIQSLLCIEQGK